MPAWAPALFGVVVIALGVARLVTARARRGASLPWDRREDHGDDFSSKRAPYDRTGTDVVVGGGLVAVGLLVVVFAVIPALR